jgi:aspartate ammonia-lyase
LPWSPLKHKKESERSVIFLEKKKFPQMLTTGSRPHALWRISKSLEWISIDGIAVNEKMLEHHMKTTIGIVTALNPIVGYEKATELAGEAYKSGKGIMEVIREKKILTEAQIQQLLDPSS